MAVNDNFDKVPPKSGTTGIPPRLVMGRGTQGPKTGTSRQKRDGWQPYKKRFVSVNYDTIFQLYLMQYSTDLNF